MSDLRPDEKETHLNLVASDRGTWHVYSDDPTMQNLIVRIGGVFIKDEGFGKYYTLKKSQVKLCKIPKPPKTPKTAKSKVKPKKIATVDSEPKNSN